MLQILKVILVVAAGFVFTILSTAFSVMAVRKAQGTLVTSIAAPSANRSAKASASTKPFSDKDLDICSKATLLFGSVALLANLSNSRLEKPMRTLFMLFGTFASYIWGARLPSAFTKVVHPLVTSSVIVMGLTRLFAMMTESSFLGDLATYKTGSLSLFKAGAGDVLLYLLGPSVVSFALSMYSRRELLKANMFVVFVSMLVSSGASLYATAGFVRLLGLGGAGGAIVRLSVLSRNVTTALAMAVTSILGGDISIACSVVVMTGILGATVGKSFLTHLGIVDPACRGLGIGGSSQGLGVAALSDEPEAFPFAAVSMVLTAVAATTMVSIPSIKTSLVNLACGNAI
jgi:putative effector of murein hydrolase